MSINSYFLLNKLLELNYKAHSSYFILITFQDDLQCVHTADSKRSLSSARLYSIHACICSYFKTRM